MIHTSDLTIRPALTLIGLPNGYVVPYVGRLPNSVTFAIFHPAEGWDYNSFRCMFGAADGTVQEVKIKKVTRYRDGGTTDIETVAGDFHFPTPFKPEEKSTFCGQEIFVEPC